MDLLPPMPIQQCSRRREETIRQPTKDVLGNPLTWRVRTSFPGRGPVIRHLQTRSAPMILEGNQAKDVQIAPSEIELRRSQTLRFPYRVPQKHARATTVVKFRIGTAILAGHGVFVPKRNDARPGF